MRKKTVALYLNKLFNLLFLLTFSPLLSADSISFGVFHAPPWGMEKNGSVQGITIDHIRAITDSAGLEAEFSVVPYPRMIKQLEQGNIDCAIATRHTSSSKNVIYLASLYELDVSVISRKEDKYTSDQHLSSAKKNPVVGFANGTEHFHPKLFNSNKTSLQLVKGHAQAPIMLTRKRVDAFVGVERLLLHELRQSNLLDDVYFPGYRVNKLQMWLQCSEHSESAQKLSARLLSAIKTLKDNGTIIDIVDQWIPKLNLGEETP